MIVVADTSIFLNFTRIAQIDLLPALYSEIVAPESVQREFVTATQKYPRFCGLVFPQFVSVRSPARALPFYSPGIDLEAGESDAIALAVELNADLVLIDERKGRRFARQLGLRTTGVLAVLLDAKLRGLTSSIAPHLEALIHDANFFLSEEERDRALLLANEIPRT